MKRLSLVGIFCFAFFISLFLIGCAVTSPHLSRSNEDLSWWGKSGASPAPVKDAERGGYWWWPEKPSKGMEGIAWGNRGYVYLSKIPEPAVATPLPLSRKGIPLQPQEEVKKEKETVTERIKSFKDKLFGYIDSGQYGKLPEVIEEILKLDPNDKEILQLKERLAKISKVLPPLEKSAEKSIISERKEAFPVILQDVYFLFNSTNLTPLAKKALSENAQVLKMFPNIRVVLLGYASPEGSREYNLKLSQKRAQAVKDYLVKEGVPESALSIKPMGKMEKIAKPLYHFARKVHLEIIIIPQ